MLDLIHGLSRSKKKIIILLLDTFLVLFSLSVAYSLRFEVIYFPQGNELWLWVIAPAIAIPVFFRFGLFRAVIEYVEFNALWAIIQAVSLYALIFGMGILISGYPVPRSVVLIHWLVAIVFVAGSRIAGRFLFAKDIKTVFSKQSPNSRNILIYGAGASGVQLANALSGHKDIHPIAFLDDNVSLNKHDVAGLKVYSPHQIQFLIDRYQVCEVLLAMPSASRRRIREIITDLELLPLKLRTLPGLAELAEGKVKVKDIRDLNIDDLLGRESVRPDDSLLHANVTNKVVMVTGAGGSIGSELCRQIVKLNPTALILYEQSEYNLYALEKELVSSVSNKTPVQGCIPVLGSVTDQMRVEKVCKRFSVNTIYHAAAYKHVPLVEMNPAAGVLNNVMGSLNTAKAAIASHVETFVLISTDKAVRPTNVMGASKRMSELVLQALHSQGLERGVRTRFSMVRFGNVLGSSGSVVPFFRQQIEEGGPVTVTHKDIIRYFMTMSEAAQLVIQAGALGEGGDVFVLDMGEPVRIIDLAKHLIHLSGLDVRDANNPEGDIEVRITGLRPGEKLYEELLIGDNTKTTSHPRILRAEEDFMPMDQLQRFIDELSFVERQSDDAFKIRDVLLRAVKGYSPQCGIVDVLADEENVQSA